ncbi:MAG: TonB-dependent receptor [Verrucomicrobiota bacterium]
MHLEIERLQLREIGKIFFLLTFCAGWCGGQESELESLFELLEVPETVARGDGWVQDESGVYTLEEEEVIGEFVEEEVEFEDVLTRPSEEEWTLGGRSSSVLAGQGLQRAMRATLGETLAGQPGVSASSYSAGASRPIIRGLDGFRVATLLDGLGTLDMSQESPDHGVAVDTALADSIEIFRGPSSLRFGSGAIGGAVNTVTRIRPTLVPEGVWETSWEAGYETQGHGSHASVRAKLADGPWAVSVYGGQHRAGDVSIPGNAWTGIYEELVEPRIFVSTTELRELVFLPNPEGVLDNSFHESDTRAVGWSFGIPDSLEMGVSFSQFASRYGIPYFWDGDETGLFGQTVIDTELNRIDAELSLSPREGWGPFSELSFRLATGWYDHAENFEGLGMDEGIEFAGVEFDRQATESRVELYNGEEGDVLRGISGVSVALTRLDARRFTPQIGTSQRFLEEEAAGVYSTQQFTWGEWSLEFGVRGEFGEASSLSDFPLKERTRTISQAASLDWETERIPGLRSFGLSLTTSLSERAPSAVERYAFWENEALGVFLIGGDFALQPLSNEQARHREVSVTADWGWGSALLTGYDTHFDNFIFLEILPGLGFERTAQYREAEARFRGLEALARFDLWGSEVAERRLEWEISGDWIVGRDLRRMQELPRMPAPKVGSTLSYETRTWDVYLELRRSFGSGRTPQEPVREFRTAPYTLLNAGASWRPDWSDDDLEISVRGTNLLNEEIREHTSFRKDTAPQPGIGVSAEVKWEF